MAGPAARAPFTLITLFLEEKGKFHSRNVMPSPPIKSPRPVSDPAENNRLIRGWLVNWKFLMVSTPLKSGAVLEGPVLEELGGSPACPGRFTVAVSSPPRMLSKAKTP